jgi:hypothetical protein
LDGRKVTATKVSVFKLSVFKRGIYQSRPPKARASEVRMHRVASAHFRAIKARIDRSGLHEHCAGQVTSTK